MSARAKRRATAQDTSDAAAPAAAASSAPAPTAASPASPMSSLPWWLALVAAFAFGIAVAWMATPGAPIVIHVQSAPTTPSAAAAGGGGAGAAAPQYSALPASAASVDAYLTPTLERLAQRSDLELEGDPVTARGGRMIMAWQTPVYRVNIASFGRDDDSASDANGKDGKRKRRFNLKAFNDAIAGRVMQYYRMVLERYTQRKGESAGSSFVFDASDAQNANQIFYEWQTSGGAEALFNHSESRQMFAAGQMAADIMLQTLGQSATYIAERSKAVGAWATVHYGCMSHLAHTHPDNVLSVVYYVRTPDAAGKLVLTDPRGPRPPFDTKIKVTPRAGDFVIFPSWLTHFVTPTAGNDERISIAFNLPGEWATTSNIRHVFDVPLGDTAGAP